MVDGATESVISPDMNSIDTENRSVPDEESPLLSQSPQSETAEPKGKAVAGVATIIAVLLLGKITSEKRRTLEDLTRDRRIYFQCRCYSGHGSSRAYILRIQ